MKKVLAILLGLVVCFGSVSALAQYEALPTENVLTKYWGFQRITGVVTKESDNGLELVVTKFETRNTPYYQVGEKVQFEVIHKKSDSLLGYRIDAYVKSDGDKNIIIAGESDNGRNSAVTLSPGQIEKFTPEKIVYYKNEEAKNTTEAEIQSFVEIKYEDFVKVDCNVIVNGKLNSEFDVYEEYKNLEGITLLDNDNDGEFEFIIVNTEE